MATYRIGEVATNLGLSVDTLRYYEKIGLLPRVARNGSGLRLYHEKDVSRLKFIQHAQLMNFTLAEIGALLRFRENPQRSKAAVRETAQRKLEDVDVRLKSLKVLRDELQQLVDACSDAPEGCPIIAGIERRPADRRR